MVMKLDEFYERNGLNNRDDETKVNALAEIVGVLQVDVKGEDVREIPSNSLLKAYEVYYKLEFSGELKELEGDDCISSG